MYYRVPYSTVTKDSRIRNGQLIIDAKDKAEATQKAQLKLEKDYAKSWYKINGVFEA